MDISTITGKKEFVLRTVLDNFNVKIVESTCNKDLKPIILFNTTCEKHQKNLEQILNKIKYNKNFDTENESGKEVNISDIIFDQYMNIIAE